MRDNPYVPLNMPAIGELFDMFDFDRDHEPNPRYGRLNGGFDVKNVRGSG